jgi:hypothetical protein
LNFACDATADFFAFSTSVFEPNAWFWPYLLSGSFLGNMFLFLVIQSDAKLQVHPMKLFGVMAFLEGSLFWLYLMEPYICPLDTYNLFYAATFPWGFNAGLQYMWAHTLRLVVWFNLLKVFLWTASINFNICLCIDLVLMIKHPFAQKGKRIVKYHIWSYSIAMIAVFEKGYLMSNASIKEGFMSWTEFFCFITYIFFGIYSCCFAFSRLSKPGVSKEVRSLITKRHISYIVFYFFCNLYLLFQETAYLSCKYGGYC